MRFDWSTAKNAANQRKHGVSFEEAQTVFYVDDALLEDRFLLLGPSAASRVLIVVHCYREADEVIRIISARKATRSEKRVFVTSRSKP